MRHFWVFMFSCCCKTRKILWDVCSMSSCWAHVEHGLSWPCATQCWAHAEPMQSPCWPRAQCMFHTTFHSQCMPVRNWAWVEAERWTTTWSLAEPGLVTSRSCRTRNAFVTSMPVLLARKICPENLSLNKDLRHKTTFTKKTMRLFMFSHYIPFPIHACQKRCMSTTYKLNNNVTLCS